MTAAEFSILIEDRLDPVVTPRESPPVSSRNAGVLDMPIRAMFVTVTSFKRLAAA
ncbi:hypothetical protein [Bradyrhizobium denitrificans]|uniref:hypothetical protein n=1 Tax=Bradyrhizobium denitrificans TaxID=2734912 RepID=UPI0003AB40A9|nr:hypothetical protein [Bradyrhizobium denitrificans]MCL8489482.1 hypothetical protein [Bradyrhizobium denitrificans]